RRASTSARTVGSEKRSARGRPKARDNHSRGRSRRGVGGPHTSADAGKRGGPPKPAELRRPGVIRTFGGQHDQRLDVGPHVPTTREGSGTSAPRTRRAVPRAGPPSRCTGSGSRLRPPPGGGGRGGGWGHQGELRARLVGQPAGLARAAADAALASSADPTGPHPQGAG